MVAAVLLLWPALRLFQVALVDCISILTALLITSSKGIYHLASLNGLLLLTLEWSWSGWGVFFL